MIRYIIPIFALATALCAPAQKLSPNAEVMLMHRETRGIPTRPIAHTYSVADSVIPETVRVFVTYDSETALDSLCVFGGRVYQTFGDGFATAEVPVDNLRAFSSLGGIRYVEMGTEVHLCNDVVRSLTGINVIHTNSSGTLPQGYTGEGVVVGIIDTGLDYNHVAFRNADGSLRIKRVWNQNANGKAPADFGYGSELVTEAEIRAAATDTRSEYHGSHTTAIAAGGDRTSSYYGMAPDADIVFVSFGQNTVDIPNAVQYIFDYAESVGKPCVINMSLGSHMGPHNGKSTLDRYFDSAVGPGRVLVGSVGNEGAANMHVGKTFTATSNQLKTLLKVPTGSNKATALDIWGTEGSQFTFKLILTDAKGRVIESSEEISSTATGASNFSFTDDNVDGYFYIVPAGETSENGPNIYVECYINKVGDTRNVGVIITGQDGASVNMWNLGQYAFVSGGFRGFTAGDTQMTAGEIGGTGESVISVGSYNSRFTFPLWVDNNPQILYTTEEYGPDVIPTGAVSFFSSCGPTVDGRIKPDVLAPGALVISAMNSYTDIAQQYPNQMVGRTVDGTGQAHFYYINIGTSMSAPVVAGSLALWLEADPTLTPAKIREYATSSATRDTNTGLEPNNNAGYGKFNALAGLNLVLANAGIDSVEPDTDVARAWYSDGTLWVSSTGSDTVTLYTVMGTPVTCQTVEPGITGIDASTCQPGVYILKFGATGKSTKLIVR